MTRCVSVSPLTPEFDQFLFATIGEGRDEKPLSVLSALARLDVDPWQEAARLAKLPRPSATESLISLIATLPDDLSAHLDAGTVSSRLIALLPLPPASNVWSQETLRTAGVFTAPQIVMYAIFMAFILVTQCIVASRQPPAQVAPAFAASSPEMPSPNSGQ